jgi:hypothetical protein
VYPDNLIRVDDVTVAPFKLKRGLQAENAVLRHYLIFAAGSLVASGLPTMIAGSLSCFTAGFRLSFRFSESSVPGRSSAGTALAFAAIGARSHGLWEAAADQSGAAGDDPSRELMCRMIGIFDEHTSREIIKNTKRAMVESAKQRVFGTERPRR